MEQVKEPSAELSEVKPTCEHRWLDIELAPKDGTKVLLWWPYWRKHPVIGYYRNGIWDTEAKLIEYGQGAPDNDEDPKLWMPLPAPPISKGEV